MSFHRLLTMVAVPAALAIAGCGESGPEVGKCTNANPELGVELDVKVVDCDSDEATMKITKETKDQFSCKSGALKSEDGTVFCTEPLKK